MPKDHDAEAQSPERVAARRQKRAKFEAEQCARIVKFNSKNLQLMLCKWGKQ